MADEQNRSPDPVQAGNAASQPAAAPKAGNPSAQQPGKNAGEWSEAYVLLSMLSAGKLPVLTAETDQTTGSIRLKEHGERSLFQM